MMKFATTEHSSHDWLSFSLYIVEHRNESENTLSARRWPTAAALVRITEIWTCSLDEKSVFIVRAFLRYQIFIYRNVIQSFSFVFFSSKLRIFAPIGIFFLLINYSTSFNEKTCRFVLLSMNGEQRTNSVKISDRLIDLAADEFRQIVRPCLKSKIFKEKVDFPKKIVKRKEFSEFYCRKALIQKENGLTLICVRKNSD